jgi:hypothetical protein
MLSGPRPPRLIDLWDDEVASNIRQPAIRKVIRVRDEEFVVAGYPIEGVRDAGWVRWVV